MGDIKDFNGFFRIPGMVRNPIIQRASTGFSNKISGEMIFLAEKKTTHFNLSLPSQV